MITQILTIELLNVVIGHSMNLDILEVDCQK